MTLDVIGSGLGRTGTKSLQSALNMLGFGPCHHMVEVFAHPETMQLWVDAGNGSPDWEAIFSGYRSAVDYPAAAYWRELTAYYPAAKVVHTVRDPDAWFESTQATIFAPDGPPRRAMALGAGVASSFFKSFMGPLVAHTDDRNYLTEYFRRHTEEVKAAIPPAQLLVYDVRQGWEPLCAFLGIAVPKESLPSENNREEFMARIRARQTG